MSIYRRRTQALLTAFWIALLAVIWVALAPIQAGGQATYVIVAGQSMEPNFQYGDLVIVHKETSYQVGDVVAYQNADIDRYVIHRIIDKKRGRFILKGDNNSWSDDYEPGQQEILGKLWIHLPKFGTYMQKLREPVYMALFAGLIGSMVAGTLFVSKKRENQHMEENSGHTKLKIRTWLMALGQKMRFEKLKKKFARKGDRGGGNLPARQNSMGKGGKPESAMETMFFALAVVAFLSLMLGLISFIRPAIKAVADNVNYQQLGFFSYSAVAPAGVYDTETIQSGNPIFPNLTCSINVNFNYTLVAESPENTDGAYQMNAILKNPQSGWQRTILLKEQTPFTGHAFDTQAILNLCDVVKLIESVEEITSVHAGIYTLAIVSSVHTTGLIAGRTLDTSFEPSLTFQYDRTQFYLVGQNDGTGLLSQSEANVLHGERNVPNTLALFGADLSVPVLRMVSLIGFLLSLGGLAVLWFQLEAIARNDQGIFVRLKYDPIMIDVTGNGPQSNGQRIDVDSIDDLAKLAEKHNTLILHQSQGNSENYFVNEEGLSYVYTQHKQDIEILSPLLEDFHSDLKHGLDRGEFQVYYQPIISLSNGQITAVEALLRWKHPHRGMIPAGDFIQMAETTGDIGKLDEWVMQVACAQLKGWRDAGHDLKLAINLSSYNLEHSPVEFVQRVLNMTGADPNWLQIEIPEGKMNHPEPTTLSKLQELKAMGVNITIDDFVGEVGLSSISQMPVSSVKIDRLLIQKMSNPAEAATMQRMIAVATALGLNVVGKGVETNEEKAFLAGFGSQAQGFLLGRPVPAQEIASLLQQSAKTTGSKPRKKKTG